MFKRLPGFAHTRAFQIDESLALATFQGMPNKEQKRMEKEVMRNAPKSVKELHKEGGKIIREGKRKEWWAKNKPAGH